MRAIFVLIGLLFDLIILAAAGFAIYCAVNPAFFASSIDFVQPYFDKMDYRFYIGGGGALFIILSFRGLFLLVFGRGDREYVLRRAENGNLTVSRTTIELLVDRLAQKQSPPAKLTWIKIFQEDSALRVRIKIKLDLANCNLGEFVNGLDSSVRTYFKDSLGIALSRLDIQAETDAGGESRA
jgi:hypothetical protein